MTALPHGAEVTLGGTVNLGNFENVRFELRASVRDQAELDALRDAFRANLLKLGAGSTETRDAIESFVSRVLPDDSPEIPEDTPTPPAPEPGPEPVREPAPVAAAVAAPPAPKEMHVPSKPVAAKKEIGAGVVCSNCQAQITASEEKASRLFVSRPLCKECLKHIEVNGSIGGRGTA